MAKGGEAVNQALASYIYNSLHQGYTLTSVRSQLATQGYSIRDINFAIDYVYATYYYGENQGDPRPTYAQSQSAPAGNPAILGKILIPVLVIFAVLIFGFAGIFLLGSNGSEINTIHTEPAAFEKPSSNQDSEVGDIDEPIFEIIAFDDVDATEADIVIDTTPSNDLEPAINPSRVGFDANTAYTKRQISEKVSQLAESNPREATLFCDEYQFEDQTSICYGIVASKSGNAEYCSQIPEGKYRDDCYLGMVVDATGSTQECDLIDNAYKRDNCRRLAEINIQILSLENIPVPQDVTNPEDAVNYVAVTADFY
jgi:hypothetical protein